jgi:hypothetical protein
MPKEFIEVFGGKACAQLINFRKIKLFGVKAAGKTNYLNQAKGFEEEAKIFVSYLKKGEQMPIPFQEMYVTTKATLLVKKAIVSGRKILLN